MKRPRVNRQAVVGTVLEYVWMIFGMFIYSFGWLACIMPANTLGGGAAGLSLLFYHITGLPIGMLTLIVNGVLLLIGGTIVGWNFGMKTIFCIAMLSVTMSVLQPLLAAVTPAGQTLFALDPVSDRILLVILGGIIAGIGIAICFRQGGSTGGTDIVAMLLQKFAGIKFSTGILLADGFVVLSGLAVIGFGLGTGDAASNGWMLTLYSLITIYTTSRVIAYLLDGASYDKLLFIISDHHEELKRFIIDDLDRSATYIKAKGMYTAAPRDMIFLVVSRKEVRLVQHKIKEIDPKAFVVVTDAYETFGEGFKQFPDKNTIQAE